MSKQPIFYEAQQGIDILNERASGRCDNAGISYYMLSRSINLNRLKDVPKLVAEIIERGAWKKWRWIGSDFGANSIDEYVTAHPPRGLGASVSLIERLLADHPKTLAAFESARLGETAEALEKQDKANQRSPGRPKIVSNENDVTDSFVGRPHSGTAAEALRRLRKDRPDIHARVLAGELSPHAGMIEAGFRKKRPSAKQRTTLQRIEALWAKLDPDEQKAFCKSHYHAGMVEAGYNELLEEPMHPDAITPEQQYAWATQSTLAHTIAAPAHWREVFGDISKIKQPSETLTLARQAIAEIKKFLEEIERGRAIRNSIEG